MDTTGQLPSHAETHKPEPPTEVELLDLFRLSPEMLCIAGFDGYFQRVNPAFGKVLGYSDAELLARPFVEFVHPDDREKTNGELSKLAESRPCINFENRYRCRDGSYRWLSWTAMPQPGGRRIYAVASDVTDRKRIETELFASEQRYRLLVEHAPDAMVVVDVEGRIVLVNAQAETLFGYPRGEMLGQPMELLVPHGARNRHAAHRADYAAHLRPRMMGDHPSISGLRKDGSEFPAEIALSPMTTGQGTLIYAAVRDVTERRRAEQTLQENLSQLLAAQRIQEHLLPGHPPVVPGFDIAGASFPAEFTAGDYFDFLAMPDQCIGIVVADVSGHGIGPAILMASTHAYMHSLAGICTKIDEILCRANDILVEETDSDRFVTLLFARLAPRSRTLEYASAGHPTALVLDRLGGVTASLPSTSLPLGIVPGTPFPVGDPIVLQPGDMALLFTDGLLEATSPEGAAFGQDRVIEVAARHRGEPAGRILGALHEAVTAFSGKPKPADDVTIVVIKVEREE